MSCHISVMELIAPHMNAYICNSYKSSLIIVLVFPPEDSLISHSWTVRFPYQLVKQKNLSLLYGIFPVQTTQVQTQAAHFLMAASSCKMVQEKRSLCIIEVRFGIRKNSLVSLYFPFRIWIRIMILNF